MKTEKQVDKTLASIEEKISLYSDAKSAQRLCALLEFADELLDNWDDIDDDDK